MLSSKKFFISVITGTGKMMIVNGGTTPGADVWRNTISVIPNTTYNFSAFAASTYFANPSQLQFIIDGNAIGSVLNLPSTTGTYQELSTLWNSGSNTSVTLAIADQIDNPGGSGSDFALDDISATPVPFEVSPTFGLLTLGIIVGISKLKKKINF